MGYPIYLTRDSKAFPIEGPKPPIQPLIQEPLHNDGLSVANGLS